RDPQVKTKRYIPTRTDAHRYRSRRPRRRTTMDTREQGRAMWDRLGDERQSARIVALRPVAACGRRTTI
ncbi:MAG: hypothetical protein M3198_10795, partial [Actinomycetota bacterium]|nr:hypothetical protein [Actinomycetota bacterium]